MPINNRELVCIGGELDGRRHRCLGRELHTGLEIYKRETFETLTQDGMHSIPFLRLESLSVEVALEMLLNAYANK